MIACWQGSQADLQIQPDYFGLQCSSQLEYPLACLNSGTFTINRHFLAINDLILPHHLNPLNQPAASCNTLPAGNR
jgi:hypothetical protein